MMKIQELKHKISEAACAEDSAQASMHFDSLKDKTNLSDNEAHYYHGLVLAADRQYKQAAYELEQVSENSEIKNNIPNRYLWQLNILFLIFMKQSVWRI